MNAEMIVEIAIVSANCLLELAGQAGDERRRHEHGA